MAATWWATHGSEATFFSWSSADDSTSSTLVQIFTGTFFPFTVMGGMTRKGSMETRSPHGNGRGVMIRGHERGVPGGARHGSGDGSGAGRVAVSAAHSARD